MRKLKEIEVYISRITSASPYLKVTGAKCPNKRVSKKRGIER